MDVENQLCTVCTQKIGRDTHVCCKGTCKGLSHIKCLNLNAKEYNAVKNVPGLKWFCDGCLGIIEFCMDIRKEFLSLKESILSELESMKNTIGTKSTAEMPKNNDVSYADMAKKRGEVIVIKPKTKQDSNKTREVVTKRLNPLNMEVGITDLKPVKDGGILIKCKTKEEIEKIKNEAEKSLGRNYKVNTPSLKNPCFKICDIEENLSDADLLRSIKSQNSFICHSGTYLKTLAFKKMKTRYMAIIECDPSTWKLALQEGRLSIGWSASCRVFDYVRLFRCYKCAGFGHKAEDCKVGVVCIKCGERDHVQGDCQGKELKCVNCLDSNRKLNLSLDICHSAFDAQNCQTLQRHLNSAKLKIKLDSE